MAESGMCVCVRVCTCEKEMKERMKAKAKNIKISSFTRSFISKQFSAC